MYNYIIIAGLILKRESVLCFRRRNEALYPLFFFLLISTLFPLAITPDPKLLHAIGPGVVWVAALLAILLALPQHTRADVEDGSLEQMVLSSYPLRYLVLVRSLAQWCVIVLPIIVISPIVAILYALSFWQVGVLLITLLMATPAMVFWGAIGAALTATVRNGGVLMMLLMLPLYVPLLIFSGTALQAAIYGSAVLPSLAWLAVLLILSVMFAPIVGAAALRIGVACQ